MEQEGRDDKKLVDEAAEDMRSDAEEMQERTEELGDLVEKTRGDWRSQQQDEAVPGAQPPPDDEAEHPSTDDEAEHPSADEEAEKPPADDEAEQPPSEPS
jgi:hypothetical protein